MLRASIQNAAPRDMRREAALQDWLAWIVQPLSTLVKHHREFVYGPVEDLVEEAIRKVAPKLLKVVAEYEIDSDVDEFLDGAVHGKWDGDRGYASDPPPPSDDATEDYLEGYAWGYENHEIFDGRKLPSGVHRKVVEEAVKEFRDHMSVRVMLDALKKAWKAVSPKHTLEAIVRAVKKHGWKLGIGFALFEVFEHFLLPTVLAKVTGDPRMLALATLPIGEVIYAIVFRILGRTPAAINQFDVEGHLDWYEGTYGAVRLATVPDFPTFDQWLTAYDNRACLSVEAAMRTG